MPSLGSRPRSILNFQDLCTISVAISRLPKRLGPRVEVNQGGQHVLQQGSRLYANRFPSAHLMDHRADKMTGCVGVVSDS